MGLIHKTYLSGGRVYACGSCKTHLALKDTIMSTAFQGQHGRAYLFRNVVNVVEGSEMERDMTTGRHVVMDIACAQCSQVVKAYNETQKYKEGNYILEKELLIYVVP